MCVYQNALNGQLKPTMIVDDGDGVERSPPLGRRRPLARLRLNLRHSRVRLRGSGVHLDLLDGGDRGRLVDAVEAAEDGVVDALGVLGQRDLDDASRDVDEEDDARLARLLAELEAKGVLAAASAETVPSALPSSVGGAAGSSAALSAPSFATMQAGLSHTVFSFVSL